MQYILTHTVKQEDFGVNSFIGLDSNEGYTHEMFNSLGPIVDISVMRLSAS